MRALSQSSGSLRRQRQPAHSVVFGRALACIAAALLVFAAPAWAVNPNSTTTSTGQGMEVEIVLDPNVGSVIFGTHVEADAFATLGVPPPQPVNVVSVVDVSGSMENDLFNPFTDLTGDGNVNGDDDCNGDGINGSAMDAACFGYISLNDSFGSPPTVSIGVVAFGDGSKIADMSPVAGHQDFTAPPDVDLNSNTIPDVEEVVRSLDTQFGGAGTAGVGEFSSDLTDGFAFQTNYDAALAAMNDMIAVKDPGGDINIAMFLSDGTPTTFTTGAGSPLADAVAAGTVVNTFALGTIAPGACDPGEDLRTIADATGGVCTEVANPIDLQEDLPEAATTNLASLELFVNGTSVDSVAGPDPSMLDLLDVDITGDLLLGINLIEATTIAGDSTPVTASTTLIVEALPVLIDIKPGSFPNSINLGSKGKLPVAILGTAEFDATQVDVSTVMLAGAAVITKKNGTAMASIEDVNGDGFLDLVLHFAIQELALTDADIEATLTGETFGGTPIEGSDSVRPVPPHH